MERSAVDILVSIGQRFILGVSTTFPFDELPERTHTRVRMLRGLHLRDGRKGSYEHTGLQPRLFLNELELQEKIDRLLRHATLWPGRVGVDAAFHRRKVRGTRHSAWRSWFEAS